MIGSGHADKGAIFSAAGDSVWAASSGYTVRFSSRIIFGPPQPFLGEDAVVRIASID